MNKKILLASIILLMLLTSGCWDRRTVDELSLVVNLGIEKSPTEPENVIVTIVRPYFEKDKGDFAGVITAEDENLMSAVYKIQEKQSKVVAFGATRVLLVGIKLAEDGLNDILTQLDHITDFKTRALVTIVDGSPSDIENLRPPQQLRRGAETRDVINALTIRELIPKTFFYEVMTLYKLKGQEILLPIMKINTVKDYVEIDKIGVFKDDKMVGTLSIKEAIPYMLIREKVAELRINLPDEVTKPYDIGELSIAVRKNKAKIKTSIKNDIPIIDLDLQLTADLVDYAPLKYGNVSITQEKTVEMMEELISTYINKEIENSIDKLQHEYGSDIFGLGEKVRVQNNKYFKEHKWPDVFPKAKINSKVQVTLRELGNVK